MNEEKKALIELINKTENALAEGTIYNKEYREALNQARQKACLETDQVSYTKSSRGHVLQD